ncbi:MAG: NAD-dependent epimerase/dehydratase family protein, partial [Candidatus Dormibacteraeota bacterium]|nr:NAD-dependent epimerase/dehydratase family protein [Candidatus Dormibacteraeota bacterium]
MAHRILITGVSGGLGALIARRLDEDGTLPPGDSSANQTKGTPITLIGLDLVRSRRRWRRLAFVRADLRKPSVVDQIRELEPDIVLHFAVCVTSAHLHPRQAHETNVVGTMNLLAGCRSARRVVAESSGAVYPVNSDTPSVLQEDDASPPTRQSRAAADLLAVEGMLADLAVANPAREVVVLRFGTILGPTWTGPLASHLRQGAPPSVMGYDPRLQLLGIDDAVDAAARAASGPHTGLFNVGGRGTVLLSWLTRLGSLPAGPLLPPLPGTFLAGQAYRLFTGHRPSPELMTLLRVGQVLDSSRLERRTGWRPRSSTRE